MTDLGDFAFKFLLVGNTCTGKTAICRRICHNDFVEHVLPTVGVEFQAHSLEIDGKVVKLQIWDTAGQEKYHSIGKAYYRNAVGVLLVFALNDHESFEALEKWYDQICKFCHPKAQVIVVGNKTDLVSEKAVTDEEIHTFCRQRGLEYIESSAKLNKGVSDAFYHLAKALYKMVVNGDIVIRESETARVGQIGNASGKQGCNC